MVRRHWSMAGNGGAYFRVSQTTSVLSPLPPPPPVFKYPMTISETKLFHFHEIFKINEIKSARRTPTPLNMYILTPFPEIVDPPLLSWRIIALLVICSRCKCEQHCLCAYQIRRSTCPSTHSEQNLRCPTKCHM